MISRYGNKRILINRLPQYQSLFKKRGIKQINQYETPQMPYPTVEQAGNLTFINHVWKQGDRYFKLASEYYGDPTLWWVIAWFNNTPAESNLELGEVVTIPLPLDQILEYYNI